MDGQRLGLFDKLRIEDEQFRHWFARAQREKTTSKQKFNKERIADLSRLLTMLRRQQDQLLNMRLLEEIDQKTLAAKGTELRDRISQLTVEVGVCDRGRAESGELALAAYELSSRRRNSSP